MPSFRTGLAVRLGRDLVRRLHPGEGELVVISGDQEPLGGRPKGGHAVKHAAPFPDRPLLVDEMRRLLKAALLPPKTEWEQRAGLAAEGWRCLDRLSRKLSIHLHFEHLGVRGVRERLRDAATEYRAAPVSSRPKAAHFAAATLDQMAQAPITRTAYLGIRHLDLPVPMNVAGVRFLHAEEVPGLTEVLRTCTTSPPRLVCSVKVTAGTDELALMRAKRAATTALALVRQKFLFGFNAKIYQNQIAFGLDGTFAWSRDEEFEKAGRWALDHPIEVDLTSQREWADGLRQLSEQRDALEPRLRERVDTCLGWLDIAARSSDWRVILPAVYSGMEALLVPESTGLKASIVTVRSAAVHVAMGQPFFHPAEARAGYDWRDQLIHGQPTHAVNEKDALGFAEDRRLWAFRVFADYLPLASTLAAGSVREVVSYLDAGPARDVCQWLEKLGDPGQEVVEEYREALHPMKGRRRDADTRWLRLYHDQAELISVLEAWPLSDAVPGYLARVLRVGRDLLVDSYYEYEYTLVAMAWGLVALEAGLRGCLGVPQNTKATFGTLVGRARRAGLLAKEEAAVLQHHGAGFRNGIVHGGLLLPKPPPTSYSPEDAMAFLQAIHDAMSDLYGRAAFRLPSSGDQSPAPKSCD